MDLSEALQVVREIPKKVLEGLADGSLKEYGGVVRDRLGRIVCHLVMPSEGEPMGEQLTQIQDMLKDQFGATSLRLDHLAQLGQIAMGLQVANLAVSVASFVIVYRRLGKLIEISKAIEAKVDKANRTLAAIEHGKLQSALDNMRHAIDAPSTARQHMLLTAKTTFSALAASCLRALPEAATVEEMRALEEGASIAMIGQSLALSELGMGRHAYEDFRRQHEAWLAASRAIAKAMLREDPQRLLAGQHVEVMPTLALVDSLDFANDTTKGILWLDELRALPIEGKGWFKKTPEEDATALAFVRHLVRRSSTFEGCLIHFKFLDEKGIKASAFEEFALARGKSVGEAPAALICVMPRERQTIAAAKQGVGFGGWLSRLLQGKREAAGSDA